MAGLARTGAIALSLAVNAGLLTLLAVEDRRPPPRRVPGHSPLYIEIEPVVEDEIRQRGQQQPDQEISQMTAAAEGHCRDDEEEGA